MLALMLGFGVVSRLIFGWVLNRIGGLPTLLLGSTMQAIALALYLPFDGLVSLYVISAIFGLAQGGIVPSYAVIIRELFPAQEAGLRVSLAISTTLAGMALGGWLAGAIYRLDRFLRCGAGQRHRLEHREHGDRILAATPHAPACCRCPRRARIKWMFTTEKARTNGARPTKLSAKKYKCCDRGTIRHSFPDDLGNNTGGRLCRTQFVCVFVALDLERQNLSCPFPVGKGRVLHIERYGMVVFVDCISAEMALGALNDAAVLLCCALIFIIRRELGAIRAHDLQSIMTACIEHEDTLRIRAVEGGL